MRRATLWTSAAVLSFALGVSCAVAWFTARTPVVAQLTEPDCASTSDFGTDDSLSDEELLPLLASPLGKYQVAEFDEGEVRFLSLLVKPSLHALRNSDTEAYRFLWFRSFHPAVAVTLRRSGSRRCLTLKQIDGLPTSHDGNRFSYPTVLAINATREVSEAEWLTFREHLRRADFWFMPTTSADPIANDGAFWTLEAVSNGNYHVVSRQSPTTGSYREACLYLLRASGLKLDEARELY